MRPDGDSPAAVDPSERQFFDFRRSQSRYRGVELTDNVPYQV
jgi:hypothetical protein